MGRVFASCSFYCCLFSVCDLYNDLMVIHGDQRRLFDLRDFGVSVVLAGVSLIDVDDNGGLFL